jgi:alkanesulfonate monooxygenase SsuD/methylene tetrahydromethanopterin reductase-like flavin-dependent oxidoreductase (luciferase family)
MPGQRQAMHLAVALEGAGWHPAAWRADDARPGELFSAQYWTGLAKEAERGLLDFVTIEDSLALQQQTAPGHSATGQVQGRLDAVLIAASVAPHTRHIGLVPTATATHTEPFHLSKAIATLDYVSAGRAGVQVRVSASAAEAAHFGRRSLDGSGQPDGLAADLHAEAADYVEVLRRLWDSWEDDAEIRDAATGRFVDRGKLHYIDFEGRWFRVKGPSITPRPPQGQPVVAVAASAGPALRLAGLAADVAFVTPHDAAQAGDRAARARAAAAAAGRPEHALHVFGDVVVYLDDNANAAAARRARLDDLATAESVSDELSFAGTPAHLADLLLEWQSAGLTGFRLRPATIPHDLIRITRALVPELQRRATFRTEYEPGTVRGRLGLARPANRYAA